MPAAPVGILCWVWGVGITDLLYLEVPMTPLPSHPPPLQGAQPPSNASSATGEGRPLLHRGKDFEALI